MRVFIIPLALVGLLAATALGAAPAAESTSLASGPYSRMQMRLERTFLGVNVALVTVRFGEETAQRLEQLASGQSYSREREAAIAEAATQAQNAMIVVRFNRDVSFEQYLDGVSDNLGAAREAGLISQDAYAEAMQSVPRVFESFRSRGFKKGDRLYYRVYPDKLRTVVRSADDEVLLDHTDPGASARKNVLSSYFAPKTDFRTPLIRSLFR